MGKVFACNLRQELQRVADDVLVESQCGFRRGRDCIDMIFCARQLIEKILEHKEVIYMTFVDLRKAYDSVPQEAMRKAQQKYGLPPEVVRLIKGIGSRYKALIVTILGWLAARGECAHARLRID